MITRTVALPNTFWEPELHIPRNDTWRDAAFDEAYNSLKHYAAVVAQEEGTGIVDRTNIINLLLSAWAIRGQKWKLQKKDPELAQRLAGMREVAKRYGLTKIWDAAYYDTMLRKLNERCTGDMRAERVYCCARCGRAIWNPLSVRRGVGPVCFHRRD
jgi:rubrerythrin